MFESAENATGTLINASDCGPRSCCTVYRVVINSLLQFRGLDFEFVDEIQK